MSNDLVSIIMPSYNCGRFVRETIESVMAQTYSNWELLFVDDCSMDDTETIMRSFDDPRIHYYKNEQNSGAAVSRNRALREAKGHWIAFLDSDDLWLPEKLERQIHFMEKNGYRFSYHQYDEIDEASQPLGVTVSGKRRVGKFDMFSCCWPGCLSVMYDRDYIGLVQINDVKKDNDSALWFKVIRKAPCYLLEENLGRYRRRKGSITPSTLTKRITAHYTLFRVAEEMNPIGASFWMCMNVVGNAWKKTFYVKKRNNP
jgi:glycosyltransferase involved in cell wall biosynthesis